MKNKDFLYLIYVLLIIALSVIFSVLIDSCTIVHFDGSCALGPITGASLISGGVSLVGNLLGGIFGKKSTQDTNSSNLQIARENNQTQIDLMHEQNAFNERMMDKQNDYNSVSNQVSQLKSAGLNPALASIQPSSSASASSTPQLSTPTMLNDGAPLANALSDSGRQIANSIMSSKQIQLANKSIESQNKLNDANARLTNADADEKIIENNEKVKSGWFSEMPHLEIEQKKRDVQHSVFENLGLSLQNHITSQQIDALIKKPFAEVKSMLTSIAQEQEKLGILRFNAQTERFRANQYKKESDSRIMYNVENSKMLYDNRHFLRWQHSWEKKYGTPFGTRFQDTLFKSAFTQPQQFWDTMYDNFGSMIEGMLNTHPNISIDIK